MWPTTETIIDDVERGLATSDTVPSLTDFLRLSELVHELNSGSPQPLSVGWSKICRQTESEE
jgi:hypothetical protein